MTKAEALEKYYQSSLHAKKIVDRLCQWDETKTLEELATFYHAKYQMLSVFARRFNLKFVRRNAKTSRPLDRTLVKTLLADGFSQAAIARLYGNRSRQSVDMFMHNTRKGKKGAA